MGMSETFKDLVEVVRIIPKLVKLNAQTRQGIRDAVGTVADELVRGLALAESRIQGAKVLAQSSGAGAKRELVAYMGESPAKLSWAFSEFKICRGLRETRDRFARPFDAAKASVRLENVRKIDRLLRELEGDEMMIIDEVGPLLDELAKAAKGPRDAFVVLADEKIAVVRARAARVKRLARRIHEDL